MDYSLWQLKDLHTELVSTLNQITYLLEKHNQFNWHQYISDVTSYLENADAYGIEKLLQAYGGMGSLSDVVLPSDQKKFAELRSSAWELAQMIQRSQDN